jgi:hypothetical protein
VSRIILDLLRGVGATGAGSLLSCITIEHKLLDVGECGALCL